MDFVLGYLLGTGATWETIAVTLVLCIAFGVIWKFIFGE
jgi:hypothetical protein